jgi:Microsomal signal peptidase 25 kDa subunit (SPC25)
MALEALTLVAAGTSQLYPGEWPQDTWIVTVVCVILYALCTLSLWLLHVFQENDDVLLTKPRSVCYLVLCDRLSATLLLVCACDSCPSA